MGLTQPQKLAYKERIAQDLHRTHSYCILVTMRKKRKTQRIENSFHKYMTVTTRVFIDIAYVVQ